MITTLKRKQIEYFTAKKIGTAINRFNMISDKDKVLVGVSGGKDSLTLLTILQLRKKWLPIDYEVKAIHITTDYDNKPEVKIDALKGYFEKINCEYIFKKVAIKEKNKLGREDCFWCSWNRRKVVFETAEEIGYKKIAFGHHRDDIVETILMNMLFNGEISAINPVQELFKGKITIIRPLALLEEKDIKRYAESAGLPVVKSSCPRNYDSKRAFIKKVIKELHEENKDIKMNILRAPTRIREEYISDVTADRRSFFDKLFVGSRTASRGK